MFNPFLLFPSIHRKLDQIIRTQENIMAAIDDLNTALDSISTEIDKVGTEVQTLITELQIANQNPAVDLSGAIAKAQAIQAKLTAIDDLVPDAPTTPTDGSTDTPAA